MGPVTFEALTGRPVHTAVVQQGHALDHIKLAKGADLMIVAPATADFMARAATGQADDLPTICLLATDAPVLLVPAMNDRMWAHQQTRHNAAHLGELGYHVLEPDTGPLAEGNAIGPGRMPEPETIVSYAARILGVNGRWRGRKVVVTAGPTREAVDPVRFISNRSSGRMGVALAAAAWKRGAEVQLITGPISLPIPRGIQVTRVESTAQMEEAVRQVLPDASVLMMAAAPADFTPSDVSVHKIKKSGAPASIALTPTSDILLATRSLRSATCIVVGFALETQHMVDHAREKLHSKALDIIVMNSATEPGAGFEVETNRVSIMGRDERVVELPLMPKSDVAEAICDRVEELFT